MLKRIQHSLLIGKSAKLSMAWLLAHRHDFIISINDSGKIDRQDPIPWRIKPVGELLFLVLVLKRHGILNKEVRALGDFVEQEVGKFDWHALAAYDPSAATPLAMVADYFKFEGLPPPFEIDHFNLMNEIGYFDGMDRVPYREMDMEYSFWRIGIDRRDFDLARIFDRTAFGRGQHLPRYSVDDTYSLTHAIFYLTDVGRRPIGDVLSQETIARLRQQLKELTVIFIRSDNVDVLGELLINWIFLGFEREPLEELVFQKALLRVLANQSKNGAIASKAMSAQRAREGTATFLELYHTTLVGTMLLNLLRYAK